MPAKKEFLDWFKNKYPYRCMEHPFAVGALAGWRAAEEKFTSTNSAMDAMCDDIECPECDTVFAVDCECPVCGAHWLRHKQHQ